MNNNQTQVLKFYNLRAPKECSQTNFKKFFIKHPFDELPTIETKDKKTTDEINKLFGFNVITSWPQLISSNGIANQDFIDDLINDNWQSIFKTTTNKEFKNIFPELVAIIEQIPDFRNGTLDSTKFISSILSLPTIYENKLTKYLKSTNLTGQGINIIYIQLWLNLVVLLYKSRHYLKEDIKVRDNLFLAIKVISFVIENRIDKILTDKSTTKPNFKITEQHLEALKEKLDTTLVLPNFLSGSLNNDESAQAYKTEPYKSKKLDGVIQIGNTQVSLDNFCIKDYDFKPCGDPANHHSAFPEGTPPSILGLGVGELIITKSQTAGYSIGEIASITNVMSGEERTFSHRKLNILEEKTEDETETLEENERELQTTEKFDLSKEVDRVVEQEASMEAGLNLTYEGLSMNVDSSFNYASSNSSSETSNESTQYAKDIVSKAVSKLSKKVRALRSTMTRKEIEEIATHKFSNIGENNENVAGIYCWVNQQINLRNFRYGRRLFTKYYIPAPALQLIHQKLLFSANSIEKPIHPSEYQLQYGTLVEPIDGLKSWQEITEENAIYWCKAFGVENIPFPDRVKVVNEQLAVNGQSDLPSIMYLNANGYIDIPLGYKANLVNILPQYDTANGISIMVGYEKFETTGDNPTVFKGASNISISGESFGISRSIDLRGKQPISLNVRNIHRNHNNHLDIANNKTIQYHKYQPTSTIVHIQLNCVPLDETIDLWKQEIYSKIIDAYNRQLTEYKENKQQMQFQKVDYGTNPNENRIIERREIQKHVISAVGTNYFMSINSVTDGAGIYGFPEINFREAQNEGKYIAEMEGLFQFKFMNMQYLSYYWYPKDKWHIYSNIKDNDPQHEAFLQAGGAIVTVPVTPGKEAHAMYLLQTGRLFFGSEAPILENVAPEIAEIIEENRIVADPDLFTNGTPIGTAWKELLPTREVYLNPAQKLGKIQAESYSNPDEYLNSQYILDEPFKIQ